MLIRPVPRRHVSDLSIQQALALAPDAASAKAGQTLAVPRQWQSLGADARALWGLCQGSGKLPYQTQVDRSDWASRCSCPSRKFPCKHGLGLMLIHAGQPDAMTETAAPAFVEEWLRSRTVRAEQRVERESRAPVETEASTRAAEKREAKREDRVAAGLQELQRWIEDLVDAGLANTPLRDADLWEQRARRLVDAQAPGMARSVAALYRVALGEDWHTRLLEELGLLHLACEAFARREHLEADTRADLDRVLGLPQAAEQLDWTQAIADDWLCLGSRSEEIDHLRMQRTWLHGLGSQRDALLLTFAPLKQPFAPTLPARSVWRGKVAFYPGSVPQRAQLQDGAERRNIVPDAFAGIEAAAALERCAAANARDPWLRLLPLWISGRVAPDANGGFWLVDSHGAGLPLGNGDDDAWQRFAASLGIPQHWFGEWDGRRLQLLQGWPA